MNHLRHISFLIPVLCLALPALAATDSPFRGGMRDIINQEPLPPETAPPQKPGSALPIAGQQPEAPAQPGIHQLFVTQDPPPSQKADKAPDDETTIWNKYKALAAGQGNDDAAAETTKDTKKKTAREEAAKTDDDRADEAGTPTAQNNPQELTGFQKILQDYQENKAKQSKMRVIEMKTPDNLGNNDTAEQKDVSADQRR